MKFKKNVKDKHRHNSERKQLISEMMQILLQRKEPRFSKQLMAQLLEEGCNYPVILAKPRFYELIVGGLTQQLRAEEKKAINKRLPDNLSNLNHYHFNEAMNYFTSHLKDFEKQMALAVINGIEQIIDDWRLKPAFFAGELDDFNTHLQAVIKKFSEVSATCRLLSLSSNQIRRRLYMALTTSLFRFTRDPQNFYSEFNSIPKVLKAMQADHHVFNRVMAFFGSRTPYFHHTASQTFWRTLQALNTDYLPEGP